MLRVGQSINRGAIQSRSKYCKFSNLIRTRI